MKKKILIPLLSLLILLVLGVGVVSATKHGGGSGTGGGGGGGSTGGFGIDNPFRGGNSLSELLKAIINNIIMPVGGVLAVLAFIYAGFLYVMAQGNENEIKKAHRALLYAAVGTVLLLGAWTFANVIENTIKSIRT